MLRPVIKIDEDKCDGCGQCILDCAEGALKIIDGKAKLISESYCDGLGACLNCPRGALKLEMREAPAFDEAAALAAKDRDDASAKKTRPFPMAQAPAPKASGATLPADLKSWPLQLALMPPNAGFLRGADLLLAAHCSAFALPGVGGLLKGRVPVIACPKLENREILAARLAAILKENAVKSLTILRMSVPCCGGLEKIAADAVAQTGANLTPQTVTVQI